MLQIEYDSYYNTSPSSSQIGICSKKPIFKKNLSFTPLLMSASSERVSSTSSFTPEEKVVHTEVNQLKVSELSNSSSDDTAPTSQKNSNDSLSKTSLAMGSFKDFHSSANNDYDNNDSESERNADIDIKGSKAFNLKRSYIINDFMYRIEEDIKTLTNTEEISNFYEYTENCMEQILKLSSYKTVKSTSKFTLEKDDLDILHKQIKRLAIFDLDETLVHCIGKEYNKAQHTINVLLPTRKTVKIGINLRPFWKEALDMIKENYIIVIFTASHESYADAVLNFMDPQNKYFKYRLYRRHCTSITIDSQIKYLKDLDIIQHVDMKNMIIVDNSVFSFAFQLDNGIPIIPYYDSENDIELFFLSYYLRAIASSSSDGDLREANKENIHLEHFIEEAKRKFEKDVKKKKKHKNLRKELMTIEEIKVKIKNYYSHNDCQSGN